MTRRAAAAAATWLPLAPLLSIAAYAVVLAIRVHSLVHDTATSDSVGPMVIAQSLPSARAGSTVVMGNAAHYTTLGFDLATRHLPGYRTIWEAMPYVLALLGLALLAETVRRLAGARAALLTVAIGIATPPLVLVPLLSQAFHGTTFFNGILLAALLAALGGASPTRRHIVPVLVAAAVIGAVTGVDIASDPLLLVTGLAPFAAAALLIDVRRRSAQSRDILYVAGGVSLVALLVAGGTLLLMSRAGFSVQGLPYGLADTGRIDHNASLLGHLVLDMGNGRLNVRDLGDLGPLRLFCGVVIVVAALLPLIMLARIALTTRRAAAGTAGEPGRETATKLFLAYWGCVVLFLAITFLATTLPVDRNSMRYLVPGFYAIAAAVPVAAMRAFGRTIAAAVAVAFTLTGVVGAVLLDRAGPDDFNVQPQHAGELIAALESRHLQHGYAGYWQANLLTWQSGGAIVSRAVQQDPACHARIRGWFCPYPIFTISDWYAPQRGPSFLIREIGGSFLPDPPPIAARPVSVFSYDRFEVYVYDHDIGDDAALNTSGWTLHQTSTP